MKCINCGFNNEPSQKNCIKCNEPLVENEKPKFPPSSSVIDKTMQSEESGNGYSKTLLGEQAQEKYVDRPLTSEEPSSTESKSHSCPFCGYQIMANTIFCPNCNKKIQIDQEGNTSNKKSKDFKGTIDPYSKTGFSLRPIINGEPLNTSLNFDGPTHLNRENTLKENLTITSKVQADIKFENGEWFISDRSEKKTTFVRPNQDTKLNKGDIILLGDTKFIFE